MEELLLSIFYIFIIGTNLFLCLFLYCALILSKEGDDKDG